MTLQEGKEEIDKLIAPYVDTCRGYQPVYTVVGISHIEIHKEFLNCLPPDIQSLVIDAINRSKQS